MITFGYSGLGPRNQIKLAMSVLQIVIHQEVIEAIAKRNGGLTFVYDVFEQQLDANGGGNAFQSDSHGMINGGLGSAAIVKGADTLPDRYRTLIDDICNLPKRVAEKSEANRAATAREYERISAAAAVMFENAFDARGKLNTNVECATRGFVGRVAQECFDRVLAFVEEDLYHLVKITIHKGAKVLAVDIECPERPSLSVRMQNGTIQDWDFDFVSLGHGTTLRVPVSGGVAARSYTETPNFDAIQPFLKGFALLDTNGAVKPGTSIAIGGLSLSMLDMLMILLKLANIAVLDPTTPRGYRINEEEAKKYSNLFTLFNREPGALSGLRTKYDQSWEGVAPLLTPEEFHAAWMHDQDMLPALLALAKADVAASCGKNPGDINRRMSTEERLADYNRQIDAMHAAAAEGRPNLTESALFRSACQSILNGQGLAANPAAAEAELSAKYPVSRAATAGWPIQRAFPHNATRFDEAVRHGNSSFFKGWGEIQNIVASAPWVCLGMLADLERLDVLRYIKASYEDVKTTSSALDIKGLRVDVLFAPKIIDPNADPVLSALRLKVLNEGMQPVFAKGRYYMTENRTVTHVCDTSVIGHGSRVEDLGGRPAMAGVSWADTNARLSALQRAPAAAKIELAAALLVLSGNPKPFATIPAPSIDQAAYEAEMANLRPHFDTLQEKLHLMSGVDKAGDAYTGTCADWHGLLATPSGRAELEEQLKDIIVLRPDVGLSVKDSLAAPVARFSPMTPIKHYSRFVDFSDEEADAIFDAACA